MYNLNEYMNAQISFFVMVLFVVALGSENVVASGLSEDKQILRDACSALKDKMKRSQCFDAVDRVVAEPVITKKVEQESPLVLNLRGMKCEQYEFTELDQLNKNELVSLYCSYGVGIEISEKSQPVADTNIAKRAHLESQIRVLETCSPQRFRLAQLIQKKYPDTKPDCSQFQKQGK